ncbi:hypothetical protein AC249_AIPGENE10120 [Exaiptasia diaphana]|nr:hypothetical protein AC249_AIPGENE10120 [Exaiptasia diaphana]
MAESAVISSSEQELEKTDEVAKMPVRTPLKKHLSSTFRPMIGQYMSDDQLADHVSRQMTFFHKKYEPEEEPIVEEKKKSKKKLRDRVLEDLELLRDYYKRIYKRALNEKVASQHKEFKTRDAQAMARERRLREKEEQDKHKVMIRLPKSKVLNDQSYKEGIQETVYHKIIKVEHQLRKQGYLSKVSEIKAFWDFILSPGNLARVLEKGKLSWEDVQHHEKTYRTALESSENHDNKKWTTSDIDKLAAANARSKHWNRVRHTRPRLFTPSGLSDISSSQSGRRLSPMASSKSKPPAKSVPNSAMTLEQLFPKVEFPALAAYTLVFGEQEPDPEEIERELELERRETAKRDTRSKLLTMFSHALANRAATQRLMERNKKFSFNQLVGSTPVSELLYHDMEPKVKALPLTTAALQAHDSEAKQEEDDDEDKSSTSSGDSALRPRVTQEKSFITQQYERLPPIEVPLSLQGLEETCSIKEAKGLSTLWVNPFSEPKKRITADQ